MSSAKTYICLDIGGTYIKHGLLTETGEILIKGKIPTRAKEGGQAVFEQAVELVEGYLEKKKTSAISEKETDFLRVDREEPFPVSLDERPDTEKHSESDFIRQTQVETDLSEADEIAVEMQDHTGKISGIAILYSRHGGPGDRDDSARLRRNSRLCGHQLQGLYGRELSPSLRCGK